MVKKEYFYTKDGVPQFKFYSDQNLYLLDSDGNKYDYAFSEDKEYYEGDMTIEEYYQWLKEKYNIGVTNEE